MAVIELTEKEKADSIAAFVALGVCTQLAEAAAGLGWKTPSSIQEQAIPHLLAGKFRQHITPCMGMVGLSSMGSSMI